METVLSNPEIMNNPRSATSMKRFRPLHGKKVFNQIQDSWDSLSLANKRVYKMFLSDAKGSILGVEKISDVNNFSMAEILKRVKTHSKIKSFVVAHNSNDGNVFPKPEDIRLIKKFERVSKATRLPMADYFIISDGSYYSHRNSIKM